MLIRKITDRENAGTDNYWSGKYWFGYITDWKNAGMKNTNQEILIRKITDRENTGTDNYWSGKYWLGTLLIGKMLVRKMTDQEYAD